MTTTEKIAKLEKMAKHLRKLKARNAGTPVAITTHYFITDIEAELKALKASI